MEVQDGAQITAAASLRRFDSTSSVGERRQLPLGGSLGRGGKQSSSCIGFALILLKRIYSFCIIFKISTNCYLHGFKKPLSVTKSNDSCIYHLYLFAKYSDL